jgi:hypothetical protein
MLKVVLKVEKATMYESGNRKAIVCVLEKVKITKGGWVGQWAGNLWRLYSMAHTQR